MTRTRPRSSRGASRVNRQDPVLHVGDRRCESEQHCIDSPDVVSPGMMCHAVAETITIMNRVAAHATGHGRIRMSPGSVSPITARVSEAPGKIWNLHSSKVFIWTAMSGGGAGDSHPTAKETAASTARRILSTIFHHIPLYCGCLLHGIGPPLGRDINARRCTESPKASRRLGRGSLPSECPRVKGSP